MEHDPNKAQHLTLLWVAGGYCTFLCLGILGGTLSASGELYDVGNAVEMPVASVLIALLLGGVAVGLFLQMSIGRYAFFVASSPPLHVCIR